MRLLLPVLLILLSGIVAAQDVSLELQKPRARSDEAIRSEWNKLRNRLYFSFANSNVRYVRNEVPPVAIRSADTLTAWRGEKVHTQLLVWTTKDIKNLEVSTGKLRMKNGPEMSTVARAGFLGYVITDEFGNGCGHRKPADFDSFEVADLVYDPGKRTELSRNQVQPVWLSLQVPPNAKPGLYETATTLRADGETRTVKLYVNVIGKTLPPPSMWSFNLDVWQHPAAIARVHNLKLWSDEHFEAMRPYYTMLAAAGQKNITAAIVEEPWNHQTYDDFPSLIKWTKKKDGTWVYDYSLFDKYVAFVMSCGIDKRINCYSMIPWKIQFPYFDEAEGKRVFFTSEVGTAEYNVFWKTMLADFARHLKEKNWFSITTIAMDERPMPAMRSVIALLKEVDAGWKIALAGDYHPEIEPEIYDYCVASRWQFPQEILEARQQQGKLSTWYTCCTEKYPNGFTFSPPAEHVWIGWYTAAKNMDGYLRWAYNSWPKTPLSDSRFTAWPAGDTYQVYPGALTSVRFEKLVEGVQDFEKIRLLREEYRQNGNTTRLAELEKVLANFEISRLQEVSAESMVTSSKNFLNNVQP